MVSNYL